jgi:hypothetical protein
MVAYPSGDANIPRRAGFETVEIVGSAPACHTISKHESARSHIYADPIAACKIDTYSDLRDLLYQHMDSLVTYIGLDRPKL